MDELIVLSEGTLKATKGDFIIYRRDWLLDNLDAEMAHLKELKKTRPVDKAKSKDAWHRIMELVKGIDVKKED